MLQQFHTVDAAAAPASSGAGERPARDGRRNVGVLAGTLLALGIGEELWQAFLPAYIVTLGGDGAAVGLFSSCRDLLDGAYQLPGGWLADRLGPASAIRVFTAVAVFGYAAYAGAWAWPVVFVGLAGAMAWKAGAFPATFALIGESLARGRRIAGFTVQSLAVRIPRVVAAPLGGVLLWRFGLVAGVRLGAAAAVALGAAALVVQTLAFKPRDASVRRPARGVFAPLSPALRRLLAAECLVRIGEAVATSFVVLYVTQVRRVPLPLFGVLYAVQQAIALALYLPAARLAARVGSRALIGVTFCFFSLFPLCVLAAQGTAGLFLAFVAGGFKEIGEPTRKAAIVDLCHPATCAREVGLYYTVRNLLVVPGGIVGGLVWQHSPPMVLVVAGAISAAGLLVFVMTSVGARRAGASPGV